MSFMILSAGWFLVAFAASWPINILAEWASAAAPGEYDPDYTWWSDAVPRIGWSIALALGITLVSTADLGWSP